MDRVSPTRRPAGRARGYQRWRNLAFFHWVVPSSLVRALVPRELEIDEFEGKTYVGLVPFLMQGVRPAWVPEAMAFEFLETNVRCYVHVDGGDPGVYFFSLDAASRIAVATARTVWGLPYHYSDMTLRQDGPGIHYTVRRRSEPNARLDVTWRSGELLGASEPGTLEHFLFERYLLHTVHRGRVYSGQVHHPPYPVQLAEVDAFEDGLLPAAGIELGGPPELCHYAAGVDVEIFDLAPR